VKKKRGGPTNHIQKARSVQFLGKRVHSWKKLERHAPGVEKDRDRQEGFRGGVSKDRPAYTEKKTQVADRDRQQGKRILIEKTLVPEKKYSIKKGETVPVSLIKRRGGMRARKENHPIVGGKLAKTGETVIITQKEGQSRHRQKGKTDSGAKKKEKKRK